MALETGTYINSLVATNPAATDGLAAADDHMRLIKSTIKATFPNITGAIDATHTELNTVADGGTSATATTLVDDDRLVVNDDGTMKQVALSDLKTYLTSNLSITSAMLTDGTIATADIADNAITAAKLANDAAFTSGMLMPYAGSSAPTGWVLCYGQAISRTTYADLFTAIGTTYGTGDGSTTFNVPDLRGRVIAGQDDMGGTSANRLTSPINGDGLGNTGGSQDHQLTEAQMPSHFHYIARNQTVNGSTGHNLSSSQYVAAQTGYSGGAFDEKYALRATSSVSNVGRTNSVGSGTAHNNVQPTIILNYIIKT